MAMSIASQVVLDPYLADKFKVVRRAEVVSDRGRSSTNDQTFANVVGVVCMSEDAEVMRQEFPEMQFSTRVISIVSKFKIQTAVAGYQPDLVVWRGDSYLVRKVSPYPQFGPGFYQSTCSSIDRQDAPI